jgi:Tol biopolymer transport system component
MDPAPSHRMSEAATSPSGDRLDSWKEIAAYLRRSVRTVHRWEKDEGLPVHRQLHKDLGSVFAYKSELDAWSRTRTTRAELEEETSAKASAPRSVLITALTLTTAVFVIAAIYYIAVGRSDSHKPQRDPPIGGLELISTLAGSQRWPSLSPDGRLLAFVAEAVGTPQVWVRNLDGGKPIQITFGDLPAVRPRWSAQGDRIIYSTRGGGIWSVVPLQGEPQRIVENGWNAELSPGRERLVFERSRQILIATADGREITPVSNLPIARYYGDAWPTFSPDGKWIAVFIGAEGRFGDYWIIPSDGGNPRRLTNDLAEGGAPAWTPDGRFVVFPSARAGSVNLWRVAVSGGVPEALTTGPGEDLDPVVAPDGRTLLFTNVRRTWTLVLHDLKTGVQKTLVEQRLPLVFPTFSRDGRQIAFQAKTSRGDMHLVVMDADGSNQMAVTHGAGELNIMPQWTGDAGSLYFYQVRPHQTFRRISIAAGVSQKIAPWSWSRQPYAAVDAHGRMAVHSVIDRGRLQESRLRDLHNGKETALPFALYLNRYSRDGRWIAGESREGEAVVCEISSGRCRPLTPKDDHGLAALAWSGDGTRLFILRDTKTQVFGELASVTVDGGVVTTYGPIGPFQHRYLMSMDASPRDEIVFALCREGPHELWLARLR